MDIAELVKKEAAKLGRILSAQMINNIIIETDKIAPVVEDTQEFDAKLMLITRASVGLMNYSKKELEQMQEVLCQKT